MFANWGTLATGEHRGECGRRYRSAKDERDAAKSLAPNRARTFFGETPRARCHNMPLT